MKTIYDFSVKNQAGETISLDNYRGKVLLIINSATKCGFTQQYEGLENLYQELADEAFEILDFPCNQFFEQAPGTNEEINAFCSLNYGTSFARFDKIDVNGESADPLFKWLRAEKTADEGREAKVFAKKIQQTSQAAEADAINWNFTKFLIDPQGNVVHRYSPTVSPAETKAAILRLLPL